MVDGRLGDYISSGASPEDIGGISADQIRAQLNGSLYLFATTIFNYSDLIPDLHGDLCAYIEQWGQPGLQRIMTQIPRGNLKTSLGTMANALWQIGREPDQPVAIFNERDANAKKWLKAIRNVVEGSKFFQQVYSDLIPPGVARGDTRSTPRAWKWSDEHMDFEGKRVGEAEYSLSAHGIDAATTGGHWPKLILDDLISVKHKQSDAEMERAREWVRNHCSLMRPVEDSLSYVNCTPWTYHDIYVDLVRDFNYKLYRRSSLEDRDGKPSMDGDPIFPAKLDKKKLLSMHKRDPFVFFSQYMCIPRPGREQHFDPAWKRYFTMDWTDAERPMITIDRENYDPKIRMQEDNVPPPRSFPLAFCQVEGILDPAPSEATDKRQNPNARNGLLIEAVDPWGRRFILEAIGIRTDYRGIIDLLFDRAKAWGFDTWRVEEVVFSNVYRHWIADDQLPGRPHEGQFLNVVPLKPGKSQKHTRITDKIAGWRMGDYYLNKDFTGSLSTEMDEYPNGLTIDLLDSMGYDHTIMRPESPMEKTARLYGEASSGMSPHDRVMAST